MACGSCNYISGIRGFGVAEAGLIILLCACVCVFEPFLGPVSQLMLLHSLAAHAICLLTITLNTVCVCVCVSECDYCV